MVTITPYDADGNAITSLTQWDYGVTIYLDGITEATSVHFSNVRKGVAYAAVGTYSDGAFSIKIPDVVLQAPTQVYGYVFEGDDDSGQATYQFEIPIIRRSKPLDYVESDNEDYVTVSTAVATAAQAAAEQAATETLESISGNFVTHAEGEGVGSSDNPVYIADDGTATACDTPTSGAWFQGVPAVDSSGVMEVGKHIDFHTSDTSTSDYDVRISAGSSSLTHEGDLLPDADDTRALGTDDLRWKVHASELNLTDDTDDSIYQLGISDGTPYISDGDTQTAIRTESVTPEILYYHGDDQVSHIEMVTMTASVTYSASTSATVDFTFPFTMSGTPRIYAQSTRGSSSRIYCTVYSRSTTGCTIQIYNEGTGSGTQSICILAIYGY